MSIQFIVGEEYRRSWLHDTYGGSRQGGITTCTRFPLMFLFTGPSGHQFGYNDGPQSNGIYYYTGMGQTGNMKMAHMNGAILNAASKGVALHLFEQTRRAMVRYMNRMQCIGYHEQLAPDRNGHQRTVIVFELRPVDEGSQARPADLVVDEGDRMTDKLWQVPLDTLRQSALAVVPTTIEVEQQTKLLRVRSAEVKVYALRRANGICEACEHPAPFITVGGRPYLEVHHVTRMADNGPDHPAWVAALCPTCHRRIHYGDDGNEYNAKVAATIMANERNRT